MHVESGKLSKNCHTIITCEFISESPLLWQMVSKLCLSMSPRVHERTLSAGSFETFRSLFIILFAEEKLSIRDELVKCKKAESAVWFPQKKRNKRTPAFMEISYQSSHRNLPCGRNGKFGCIFYFIALIIYLTWWNSLS